MADVGLRLLDQDMRVNRLAVVDEHAAGVGRVEADEARSHGSDRTAQRFVAGIGRGGVRAGAVQHVCLDVAELALHDERPRRDAVELGSARDVGEHALEVGRRRVVMELHFVPLRDIAHREQRRPVHGPRAPLAHERLARA